jgi:hypothetical protein
MKCLATLAILVLFVPGLAFAQGGGVVCLFANPQGTNCTITDASPTLLQVYVVHSQANGVMAVSFSAPKPECMLQAQYLSDTSVFPVTMGDSQHGAVVGYPRCLSSPIHVLTINYFGMGMTPADCAYPVLPNPMDGGRGVLAFDCGFNDIEAQGGTTYINSNLPCQCSTSPTPLLRVYPIELDFGDTGTTGGFAISSAGMGTLTWNVSEEVPWLTASPASGTGNATITVTVDRWGLPAGNHSGVISVTSNGGNETVTATLVVPIPILGETPTSLSFANGATASSLAIRNSGNGNLHWSIASDQPWLRATPLSGTTYTAHVSQITVTIDRERLGEPATYFGNLSVTSDGGNLTVPVVVDGGPALRVSTYHLVFTPSLTTNTFTIENRGGGTLEWSLAASQSWIEIAPPLSGTGNATVTVNVDPAAVPCCDVRTGGVVVDSNGGQRIVEVRYEPTEPNPGGTIGVYADQAGKDCNIPNVPSGLMTVYVFHTIPEGATASQFSAPKPACMTGATWVSDTSVFPVTLGSSQTGVTVGYGTCRSGPLHVLTITYAMSGPSEPCCMYPVLPDPSLASGKIEIVDCGFNLMYGTGTNCTVNSNSSCICGRGAVVPAEKTTWGHVKALYAPE